MNTFWIIVIILVIAVGGWFFFFNGDTVATDVDTNVVEDTLDTEDGAMMEGGDEKMMEAGDNTSAN